MGALTATADRLVRLPRTSGRQQASTFVRVVERVLNTPYSHCFEGPAFRPGESVPESRIARFPVLECAGTVGKTREFLWIVWKRHGDEWREIGRAVAPDASWVQVLRPLIQAELQVKPVDLWRESNRISDQVLNLLDRELETAVAGVRINCLSRLHGEVTARMV